MLENEIWGGTTAVTCTGRAGPGSCRAKLCILTTLKPLTTPLADCPRTRRSEFVLSAHAPLCHRQQPLWQHAGTVATGQSAKSSLRRQVC